MLNISFLACTKVELLDLTVCIAVNGEKFQIQAATLILARQCPISNLSELFSYTTTYLNFMFLDQFLFDLSCKNTETQKHGITEKHTDSDEYKKHNLQMMVLSFYIFYIIIVVFLQNAPIEYSSESVCVCVHASVCVCVCVCLCVFLHDNPKSN